MSGNQTSGREGGVQCVVLVVCMYIYLMSYMSHSKETQACRLVAGLVPVYILRPAIRMQLYFAQSFGAFLRTSAPSDTFGNLLRYYEVPPYSLPFTLSEAHVTNVLLINENRIPSLKKHLSEIESPLQHYTLFIKPFTFWRSFGSGLDRSVRSPFLSLVVIGLRWTGIFQYIIYVLAHYLLKTITTTNLKTVFLKVPVPTLRQDSRSL